MMKSLLKQGWWSYKSLRSKVARRWYAFKVREKAAAVGDNLKTTNPTNVNSKTEIGDNVLINGLEIRGSGKVTIGDNFRCGPGIRILTQTHDYEGGLIPYGDEYKREPVHIEENVWLGVGVIILPGVRIGEGAIVQAGSTVIDDVSSGAIVGGHPAKKFAERNMERYSRLKKQEKIQKDI